MKQTFSLYFQVTVLFVLISLLSIMGAGVLSYFESRRIIILQAGRSMRDVANTIGSSLNERIDDAKEAMMRISQHDVLYQQDSMAMQNFLQAAVYSSALFSNIYYFSPAGPLLAVAYADNRDLSRYAAEDFNNYATREKTKSVYHDLVKARDGRMMVFSDFFKSETGRLMSSFIIPVSRDSNLVGILSCGLVLDKTSRLLDTITGLKPHPDGYIALIDAAGNLLLHTGVLPQGFVAGPGLLSNEIALATASGYLQSVHFIKETGLGVCIGMPESAVTELLDQLRNRTIIFVMVVGGVATILGLLAASLLIAPLNDLVRGLKQLRAGKSGEHIDRWASGEIAEAVSAYNDLNDKVKKDAMLSRTWTDLWNA